MDSVYITFIGYKPKVWHSRYIYQCWCINNIPHLCKCL